MLCPAKGQCRERKRKGTEGGKHAYIFPTKNRATLATVDVSDSVVACGHLTVIWLTLNNVNAVHVPWLATARPDGASALSYTSSNKYARPCWPLNAWRRIGEPGVRAKGSKCVTDPGYHGMNSSEMSAAAQAAVYASACQVTSITHAHYERY